MGEFPGCISIKTTKYSVAYQRMSPDLYSKCLRPNRLMEVRQFQKCLRKVLDVCARALTSVCLVMPMWQLTCGGQRTIL